jgi:hypothetical protein
MSEADESELPESRQPKHPTLFPMQRPALLFGLVVLAVTPLGQQATTPQASAPSVDGPGRFQAVYPVQYEPMSVEHIATVLARMHGYLDSTTPPRLVDRNTGAEIVLRKGRGAEANINDGSVQFAPSPSRI